MLGTKEIDYEAINQIAINCSSHDYEECKRLLTKQNNELIEKIYYELMYTPDGMETDFIPLGCTYEKLVEILVSLGGKPETFGEKTKRRVRKHLKEYESRIKELEQKLKKLDDEFFEKTKLIKNRKRPVSNINKNRIQFILYKKRLKTLNENLKYRSGEEKQTIILEINKIKEKIKNYVR